MNFNAIEKSFSRIIDMLGGGVIALILALLVLGLILFFVFKSGKQIRIRIPFLPRGMNVIKIGKDDLKKLSDSAGGQKATSREVSATEDKQIVHRLFAGMDAITGSVKKRYDLPLYLLISQYESTTELLQDAGRDVLQRLEMKDGGGSPTGSCVILNRGGLIHHQTPEVLVEELIENRPERPLDGIVFVLPLTDLLIEDRRERRARVDWLFKQYWSIQTKVEFNFPIYLLIPGIEELVGFEAFWAREEVRSRLDEIFGWSSPYNVDSPFDKKMLDEAFSEIDEFLNGEVEKVTQTTGTGPNEILLFASAVRDLLEPVKEFADGVLNSSALLHQPKFRGIYFTGRIKTAEQDFRHRFLERLFLDKVFGERALAVPLSDRVLSANRRLKSIQVLAGSILAALIIWIAFDVFEVNQQRNDIEELVVRVDDIWREESGYKAIAPSLDLLTEIDASELYCCGPIPWSRLIPNANIRIERFFQEELFSKKIFPVMECKSRQRIFDLVKPGAFTVSERLQGAQFDGWLSDIVDETRSYSRVRYLMGDVSYRSERSIATEFSNVVASLFGEAPPPGFGDSAELYLKAIAANDYNSSIVLNRACPSSVTTASSIWENTLGAAVDEIGNEVKRISAPLGFIQQILAFESGALNSGPIDREQFSFYVEWYDHLSKAFEGQGTDGFCATTERKLTEISGSLAGFDDPLANPRKEIENFVDQCQKALAAQMTYDNTQLPKPLYSAVEVEGQFAPQISPAASRVFALIGDLSDFSFSSVEEENWQTYGSSFFWSVDLLAQALNYSDEYRRYAEGRFKTIYLPENPTQDRQNYLAQAVALAQLQRAMLSTIEKAKFQEKPNMRLDFSTIDAKEARIADRVENFKKALNPLLALASNFEQLGLQSARRKLLIQAHGQASRLLEEVNDLFFSNRIYKPKINSNWKANDYPEAFFGLLTDGNAKDYLAAQAKRSQMLARDYAQPLVVFLANTQGQFKETEIVARWKHTLVELTKQENQDPSNDLNQFEQFFLGDFAATSFSNCHENVKNYQQPVGSSVFAMRWRELVNMSSVQCRRLQADNIKKEYAVVSESFEKYLAPYYPFNSMARAKPLSPNNLREFLKIYSGSSDGLAERIRVLAWKNQQFSPAEQFLRDLDASLAILDQVVKSSDASGAGISIEAVFNPDVEPKLAFDPSNHISSKRLYAGKSFIVSPGQPEPLQWKFSDETRFHLDWASGSPYMLFSQSGDLANDQLSFSAKGYWSLIRFIEEFRSQRVDASSLRDESMLLEFKGQIQKSSSSNTKTPIGVFVRLTLIGIDPDTQSPKALQYPNRFPNSAPMNS